MVTSGVEDGLTVIVIGVAVAVAGEGQVADDVIITVTWSPLPNVVVLNVFELVPALLPFTFHWYDGVEPPLVGEAVKVTFWPPHMLVVVADIDTAGVTGEVTSIVTAFEVAVVVETQLALEVITTVTTSPFTRLDEVNVAEFVPTFVVFTFH